MTGVVKPVRLVGVLSVVAGAVMVVTGGVVWGVITSQLAAEKVVVAKDASFLAGDDVNGPFSAYAQAEVIKKHALAGAEGMTFAELGTKINEAKAAGNDAGVARYTAMRQQAMNGSFLRASLFTSVLSYGVCFFAMGMGLLVSLVGWSLTRVAKGLELAGVGAPAEPTAPVGDAAK